MFQLTDSEPETGRPVVEMTKTEYILLWLTSGIVFMLAARWFLVQPLIDALKH